MEITPTVADHDYSHPHSLEIDTMVTSDTYASHDEDAYSSDEQNDSVIDVEPEEEEGPVEEVKWLVFTSCLAQLFNVSIVIDFPLETS